MFNRRCKPDHRNIIAAGAALFVVSGFLGAPALAATSAKMPCPDAVKATLHVPDHILVTHVVNHNAQAPSVADAAIDEIEAVASDSLLAPGAEAAIRHAFELPGAELIKAVSDDESKDADPGMNTKLPGISDENFSRYKKQMYRRDI